MRQTRKVVKDGIPVGMNRGEAEDKRAEKVGELARYRRDNGSGQIRSQVDGFATVEWQCSACGGKHKAIREHAGGITAKQCPSCGLTGEHERVFPALD